MIFDTPTFHARSSTFFLSSGCFMESRYTPAYTLSVKFKPYSHHRQSLRPYDITHLDLWRNTTLGCHRSSKEYGRFQKKHCAQSHIHNHRVLPIHRQADVTETASWSQIEYITLPEKIEVHKRAHDSGLVRRTLSHVHSRLRIHDHQRIAELPLEQRLHLIRVRR